MTAAHNTKVELLAEAIENMALQITVRQFLRQDSPGVVDSRQELRVALRAFLQPALRVIEGGLDQQHDPYVSLEDRPTCKKCGQHMPCDIKNCQAWHQAVRVKVGSKIDELQALRKENETGESDPGDDDPTPGNGRGLALPVVEDEEEQRIAA
jgi:hypothetical protein